MKIFPKIKFNRLKNLLKKLPKILAENAFLTILILFFFFLIISGLIFYEYVILVEKAEPQIIKKPSQFNQNSYQRILEEWEKREKKFQEAGLKEYKNFFSP